MRSFTGNPTFLLLTGKSQ